MRSTTRILCVCAAASAALLPACAISKSISDSVSESVESLSDSVSSISPGGDSPSMPAYENDVKAYAAVFAESPGTEREFLRGIGRVAERHGITHWDARPETLVAAGQGLRRGGMTVEEMDDLRKSLSGLDESSARLVLEGYENEGR